MNLNKEILRLSIPAIISNITVPLLGLSDTTIAGHIGSDIYLGAIAVGSMMFNSVFWLFGFLRMGTTGLTAQAFGEKNATKSDLTFLRALILALSIGLVFILLQTPIKNFLLDIISPSPEVEKSACTYFNICIWGAPATLINMSISGWFLGRQNTIYPMVISISINIVNIVLSVMLVFLFNVGFKGIAIGSLAANWCGIVLALFFVIKFNKYFPSAKLTTILKIDELKQFFSINSDIFLRTACIMSVSLAVTSFGAHIGNLTLASNAIMMQFFLLFSYFMDGIAFTGEALSGRFKGECNISMLKKTIKQLCLWSAVISALFTIIYALFNREIAEFITSEPSVIAEVCRHSVWLILIPSLTVGAFVFDGIYIGLTATRQMLVATSCSTALFFIICLTMQTTKAFDNNILWIAFLSYLFARGSILGLITPGLLKKSVKNC